MLPQAATTPLPNLISECIALKRDVLCQAVFVEDLLAAPNPTCIRTATAVCACVCVCVSVPICLPACLSTCLPACAAPV